MIVTEVKVGDFIVPLEDVSLFGGLTMLKDKKYRVYVVTPSNYGTVYITSKTEANFLYQHEFNRYISSTYKKFMFISIADERRMKLEKIFG